MGPEILILIAVFALMMWMMSRGAKKQRNAAAELRAGLSVGDRVMTASGFYGTIVDIDGDAITLESTPGVETVWKREAIHSVSEPPFAAVDDEDEADGEDLDQIEVPDDASSLTGDADDVDETVAAEQPDDSTPSSETDEAVEGADTPDDADRRA